MVSYPTNQVTKQVDVQICKFEMSGLHCDVFLHFEPHYLPPITFPISTICWFISPPPDSQKISPSKGHSTLTIIKWQHPFVYFLKVGKISKIHCANQELLIMHTERLIFAPQGIKNPYGTWATRTRQHLDRPQTLQCRIKKQGWEIFTPLSKTNFLLCCFLKSWHMYYFLLCISKEKGFETIIRE